MSNSVDPDDEPSHLDLHYLQKKQQQKNLLLIPVAVKELIKPKAMKAQLHIILARGRCGIDR